jgi:hypothetical protein
VAKVVAYVRYNTIREKAERSRRELTCASVVAAAALVGFAWAANPKEKQSVVVLKSPAAEATLTLTDVGKKTLAPLLGSSCIALDRIPVIVLGVSTTGSDIVSLKSKDCLLAHLTITDTLGRLYPG